jgi:hypothetical protein
MTKLVTLVLAGLVCLASGSVFCAEQPYPTNIELVEQAVSSAVDSMDLVPPAGTASVLEIEAAPGSEGLWLVDNVLKGRLIEGGWSVTSKGLVDSVSVGEPQFVLKIRVDLSLIYARSWRRHLFFGRLVERVARASIFYDLIDKPTGTVIVASSVQGESRDVVPASALAALTDAEHKFAAPEMVKGQWDRYIEGGLVLAIVGVLIYLFYSNKTA